MLKLLILACMIFASSFLLVTAEAAPCKDLPSCALVVHQLTGQRYFWEANTDKKIQSAPELELTKENAEIVFTAMLDHAGFARLPVGDGITYRIVRSVELKETTTPIVDASADQEPSLPNTWDWVTMRYRMKSREPVDHVEASYRLHVPREARMQADYAAGYLIVTGSAPMVRHMYQVLKGADVPYTAEVRAHLKESMARWERMNTKTNEGKK